MALINIGAGLSKMGEGIAQTAQAWTLQSQRDDAERDKLKLIQEFTAGENVKSREAARSERIESQAWQGGEKDKDRSHQEKMAEAQRQAQLAAASISAGASMSNARLAAQVQREGQEIQREALTPAEVRTAKWFAGASPEEQKAFQDTLLAKMQRAPREAPPGYKWTETGDQVAIKGGPADTEVKKANAEATRAENEKAIPATVQKGIQENLSNLRQVDKTLDELTKTPGSVGGIGSRIASVVSGVGNLQNSGFLGTGDPEGATLRAKIADIGSLVIHQRSGAAVTAAEFPRLKPFIPSIADDPETVRKKLLNFKAVYEDEMRDTMSYYSRENGFKPYTAAEEYLKSGSSAAPSAPPPPPSPPAPAEPEKRAIGKTYMTPAGPRMWLGNGWLRPAESK